MICLADNDVLLKLAACNLLDDAVPALETTKSEFFVLPTAKYKIGYDRQNKLQAKYGVDGIKRTLEFIQTVQEIVAPPDIDERDLLLTVDNIDAGEDVLFAATQHRDVYIVATGDKRCLRALASAPTCQPIYDRMSGRVICLEQIIARLIPHLGFNEVRQRVVPVRDCDTSLKAAFGSGLQASEENVRRSLASRITDIRAETGNLLVLDNEWVTQ